LQHTRTPWIFLSPASRSKSILADWDCKGIAVPAALGEKRKSKLAAEAATPESRTRFTADLRGSTLINKPITDVYG
jgi:hypothetical protein